MLRFLTILVLAAATGLPQAPTSVQPRHKVGDTLRYTVIFDGDPDFTSITLYFSTADSDVNQPGLRQNFNVGQTQKLGPGKFKVEGTIPESIVTGRYALTIIQARLGPYAVKDYEGARFHQDFEVENPAKFIFPPLKNVTPE